MPRLRFYCHEAQPCHHALSFPCHVPARALNTPTGENGMEFWVGHGTLDGIFATVSVEVILAGIALVWLVHSLDRLSADGVVMELNLPMVLWGRLG